MGNRPSIRLYLRSNISSVSPFYIIHFFQFPVIRLSFYQYFKSRMAVREMLCIHRISLIYVYETAQKLCRDLIQIGTRHIDLHWLSQRSNRQLNHQDKKVHLSKRRVPICTMGQTIISQLSQIFGKSNCFEKFLDSVQNIFVAPYKNSKQFLCVM